jgi:Asp-tRNA(Asn)/Glu-tRNA(Gln) amidotransferase C subunit
VKPAQEKLKTTEQQARTVLEETIKPITEQYQKITDSAEDAYRMMLASMKSQYNAIEMPARARRDEAIEIARNKYIKAVSKLWKGPDYGSQKYHDPLYPELFGFGDKSTNEPVQPEQERDQRSAEERFNHNCFFCGAKDMMKLPDYLFRVAYKLKDPSAGLLSKLFGRDWKYSCYHCANTKAFLWGVDRLQLVMIDRGGIDKMLDENNGMTYYCGAGRHSICAGLECTCDCHKQGKA